MSHFFKNTRYLKSTRLAACLCWVGGAALAQAPAQETTSSVWVAESNRHAEILTRVMAEESPESAVRFGVPVSDEAITQFPLDRVEKFLAKVETARKELEKRLAAEEHPAVRQDLEILIAAARDEVKDTKVNESLMLPFFDAPRTVFYGLQSLLDEQVEAARRTAAVTRYRRYAGVEEGFTPLLEQAAHFIRARFDRQGLVGPFRGEVEQGLKDSASYVDGIAQLFETFELDGWQEAHRAFSAQVEAWDRFVTEEVMPRTRHDFRLPPEVYASNLAQVGVDMPVAELVSRAKVAFREIQNEAEVLAALIAAERGWEETDYRSVVRRLKKDQVLGEAVLPLYKKRIAELERLIERHSIVSLPEREMRIRLASEAESTAIPAPHMRPPRLIGNTGEQGEFVLPMRNPSAGTAFDDFSSDASTWTLAVHEGRPGHEMQFAAMVEKGVSLARALFALNSVNVEGWALYAEAEMKPYLPLEGQLFSLQSRLLRAARAFLDPGLQSGEVTPEDVHRVLTQDVLVSEAAAQSEIQRYTYRIPGQATAYFCGYTRLLETRADAERLLGTNFDRKAFHDFVLGQGMLSPSLLRKAVLEEFVPAHRSSAS